MEIRMNDTFLFHSLNGMDYKIRIVSINNYREPLYKYGCDILDENGNYVGSGLFFGDDFFETNKDKIEKAEE